MAETIQGITPTMIAPDRSSHHPPGRKQSNPRNSKGKPEFEAKESSATAVKDEKNSKQKSEKENPKGTFLDRTV